MAINIWLGNAGNWSDDTKWSLSAKPVSGDDVVLSAGSGNCVVNEAPATLNTFTITSGFSGTFSAVGYNFNINSTVDVALPNTGVFNVSGTWTQTGNGNFIIGTGSLGTYTSISNMNIDLQGTGTLKLGKNSQSINDLTCAYTGKTTTFDTFGAGTIGSKKLTIGPGTVTMNCSSYTVTNTSDNNPLNINTSATVNGTANFVLNCNHETNTTINLPKIAFGGSIYFYLSKTAGSGNITYETNSEGFSVNSTVRVYRTGTGSGNITWNTNGYYISTQSLSVGSTLSGCTLTINFSNSNINWTSFTSNVYNTGITYLNLGTSTINSYGSWTYGTNAIVNEGTSQVTFNTNDATITSNGKKFYDVILNQATKTYTFADATSLNRLTLTDGNVSWNGTTLTSVSDIGLSGTGTANLGNGITMTSDGNLVVTNSGTNSTSSCIITLSGNTLMNMPNRTISRLILNSGKTLTRTAGNTLIVSNYTSGDWDGTTWISNIYGIRYGLSATPSNINVRNWTVTDCDASYGNRISANDAGSTVLNCKNIRGRIIVNSITQLSKYIYRLNGLGYSPDQSTSPTGTVQSLAFTVVSATDNQLDIQVDSGIDSGSQPLYIINTYSEVYNGLINLVIGFLYLKGILLLNNENYGQSVSAVDVNLNGSQIEITYYNSSGKLCSGSISCVQNWDGTLPIAMSGCEFI